MKPALTAEQLERLRRIDACTLANAIETFNERLRNEGFVDHSIACLFPKLPPIIGFAATVRIRGAAVPTAGNIYPDRSDWWDYVQSLPTPRILVVQDVASKIGLGSMLGAVHANILRALGCVGAVTNGSVRDVPTLEELGFQVFAGGICVSHAYIHITDFGIPVEIGGLKISSGDLLHGDMHGVQSIPPALAEKIPAVAAKISAKEGALIELCQSKDFSLDNLRAIISRDIL